MKIFAIVVLLLLPLAVHAAWESSPPTNAIQPKGLPKQLQQAGITQKLNDLLPLDLQFRDEKGRAVKLRDYFTDKPVILSFAYYRCPMLCPYVLSGLAGSLKTMSLDAGKDYHILTVSFDPTDTPGLSSANKAKYVRLYGRSGANTGWTFLTGSQDSIQQLTTAAGFRYDYDASQNQFAHASGILIATPEGRISRYFYGIEYAPRDLRLSLVEAGGRKIGSRVDQLLLYCFHYNPLEGKYSMYALGMVRVGGILTVGVLGFFVLKSLRRKPVA
jgi:protein SCO1